MQPICITKMVLIINMLLLLSTILHCQNAIIFHQRIFYLFLMYYRIPTEYQNEMPTNKNAQFRYRVIDHCLRNRGRKWNIEDLIAEVSHQMEEQFFHEKGISKRTIMYDLNVMRSDPPRGFGAPIICNEGYYLYEEKDFSIINSPLIESDKVQIQEAVNILKQFRGLPHFAGLEQVLYKIEGQVTAYGRQEYIHFETNEDAKGPEWLTLLYGAISGKQVLQLEYQPFKSDNPMKITLHPYFLKEYNNRWFLFGYNEEVRKVSIHGLDRIVNISAKNKKFKENKYINPSTVFNNIIGVTIQEDEKIIDILFRAITDQAPYIKTKPIHKSQRILFDNDEYTEFMISVVPNFELEQLLLSFGEHVIVISPETFRDKIADRIEKSRINYVN